MDRNEMKDFWIHLPKPFFALAPLANVTDAAFRALIAKYSKPHGPAVMYTEFVSADGLMLANEEGKQKLLRDLLFADDERPIVAQFFTSNLEMMKRAAGLAAQLGFDGIDINMGCPDRIIEKQGAGAALIKNFTRAQELIAAAKTGAPNLPISIKTRLGYTKDVLDEWLPALLEAEPAAIAIHARTRKELSEVSAHWDRIKHAVEIRNEMNSKTLIIGNGDVVDLKGAQIKAKESGADGVMLGRAIFGRPWLFNTTCSLNSAAAGNKEHIERRLHIAIEHAKLFDELLGDIKSFSIMKKHFKVYVEGFDGAKELRVRLMEAESYPQVSGIIEHFLRTF